MDAVTWVGEALHALSHLVHYPSSISYYDYMIYHLFDGMIHLFDGMIHLYVSFHVPLTNKNYFFNTMHKQE